MGLRAGAMRLWLSRRRITWRVMRGRNWRRHVQLSAERVRPPRDGLAEPRSGTGSTIRVCYANAHADRPRLLAVPQPFVRRVRYPPPP